MLDHKTIRRQRLKITAFFVSLIIFILSFFPFYQSLKIYLSQMIYSTSTCTGMNPDYLESHTAASSENESADSFGSESAAPSESKADSSKLHEAYVSMLEKLFYPLLIVCAVSFISSVVLSFFMPKAFSILRKAKQQKKMLEAGEELPVSPEDLEGHTLRPGEEAWNSRPQDEAAQDLGSLFVTTARIYDGKEITESVPGETDDTSAENFSFLEDLYFLGSEERIF